MLSTFTMSDLCASGFDDEGRQHQCQLTLCGCSPLVAVNIDGRMRLVAARSGIAGANYVFRTLH